MAGDMAPSFRKLAAVPENPDLIPTTNQVVHKLNFSSKKSYELIWLLWAQGIHFVQYIFAVNTHTYNI